MLVGALPGDVRATFLTVNQALVVRIHPGEPVAISSSGSLDAGVPGLHLRVAGRTQEDTFASLFPKLLE